MGIGGPLQLDEFAVATAWGDIVLDLVDLGVA